MFNVLVNLYGHWAARNEAKSARKQTINELSRLNDYDLQDIGINRGDIRRLAQDRYNEILQDYQQKSRPVHANMNLKGWV